LSKDILDAEIHSMLVRLGCEINFCSRNRKLDTRVITELWMIKLKFTPDIVISYDFSGNVISAINVIGTSIRWYPCVRGLETAFTWWRSFMLRILFPMAKRVIVPSSAVSHKLEEYKITSQKNVVVIPNGIVITPHTRPDTLPVNMYRLVCVANFYSIIKGQHYAVEALNMLPDNYFLDFIGDGEEQYQVIEMVKRYRLEDRIKFLGVLDNSKMRNHLVNYDLMVVPSLSESFGICAIEGMAAGLPIVATHVGGLPEVVDETCGRLVPAANPKAMADAVNQFCEDTDVWKRVHEGALNRVKKHFSVEAMASRYYQTFSEANVEVENV